MTKQQGRRRRKRYQPGSAYAGDIRPSGIFSIFGNVKLFFIIGVVIMGGSLLVGGILRSGFLNGTNSNTSTNFVQPKETANAGTVQPTPDLKQYTSAPALTLDASKRYTATIKTSLGDIEVELLAAAAPQTVNNFVFLARDGFYNGLTFWQVVPGFDVQAGDPGCQAKQAVDTCRGSGDPGYTLSPEPPPTGVSYAPGTLGMANASQFFIALTGASQFSQYTPFGRVTSGLDVAQKITKNTAIDSVTIQEQ